MDATPTLPALVITKSVFVDDPTTNSGPVPMPFGLRENCPHGVVVPMAKTGLAFAVTRNTSLLDDPMTKYGAVPPGALTERRPYGDVVAIPTDPLFVASNVVDVDVSVPIVDVPACKPDGYRADDVAEYPVGCVKGSLPLPPAPVASTPHERTPVVDDFTSQFAALSPETIKFVVLAVVAVMAVVDAYGNVEAKRVEVAKKIGAVTVPVKTPAPVTARGTPGVLDAMPTRVSTLMPSIFG